MASAGTAPAGGVHEHPPGCNGTGGVTGGTRPFSPAVADPPCGPLGPSILQPLQLEVTRHDLPLLGVAKEAPQGLRRAQILQLY